MPVHERDAFVERRLIKTVQVGKVDLEPAQTTFTQRLGFAEQKHPTAQIVTNVTQVRRNWISASAEVEVMGKKDSIKQELKQKKISLICNL